MKFYLESECSENRHRENKMNKYQNTNLFPRIQGYVLCIVTVSACDKFSFLSKVELNSSFSSYYLRFLSL